MALERRTWRTLTCALVAIVLVVLCCRVTGNPTQRLQVPGIDANGPIIDDTFPPIDAPDDAPEPQLDAPVT